MIGARIEHPRNTAELIQSDIMATKGAALIDVLLLWGSCSPCCWPTGSGASACRFSASSAAPWAPASGAVARVSGTLSVVLLFAGFMLFSFMTNIGPNAMTYLIAGEVFPISIRGAGAGFAASFAKIGAVLDAFLFPILLKDIGTHMLLLILVGTSLLARWSPGSTPSKPRRESRKGSVGRVSVDCHHLSAGAGGGPVSSPPLQPSIWRASAGVATVVAENLEMLAAFSTSAALLGASLPSRDRCCLETDRGWPPSRTVCATIGNWCSEMPKREPRGARGK